jgi:hypothetical protein
LYLLRKRRIRVRAATISDGCASLLPDLIW